MKKIIVIVLTFIILSVISYYSLMTANFKENPLLYKGSCPFGFVKYYPKTNKVNILNKNLAKPAVMAPPECISIFQFLIRRNQ